VRQLRSLVEDLARQGVRPLLQSRLLSTAAYISGLLGALALDLGRPASARAYAREAFELAQTIELPALQAWARATQSLVEYYSGSYDSALAYALDGQRFAANGPHAVRLALNGEARALGKLGDRRGVDEAVDRGFAILEAHPAATEVSPSLSTEIYCVARAAANAATAYLALRLPEQADQYALQAITSFDEAQLHGPQALTRLDLATSLLVRADADPEHACQLASEALALTDHERFGSVLIRASEFLVEAQPWAAATVVSDVADQLAALRDRSPLPH
jgi:hypothetical protein